MNEGDSDVRTSTTIFQHHGEVCIAHLLHPEDIIQQEIEISEKKMKNR